MRYSSRKLSNDKVITTACNFWRQIACSFQVMSGSILFLGNKIFEIPPVFQTRPGDLGKNVHACSLRFSALNNISTVLSLGGDWALASNNNSPGEGDITLLRQISTHPPPSKVGFFVFICFHSTNERSAGGNHRNTGLVKLCCHGEVSN